MAGDCIVHAEDPCRESSLRFTPLYCLISPFQSNIYSFLFIPLKPCQFPGTVMLDSRKTSKDHGEMRRKMSEKD